MIDINDVTCEYAVDEKERFVEVEDLKATWNDFPANKKENLYTVKKEHLRFDARDVIETAIDYLSQDGYEDMYERAMENLTNEDIDELQKVLDKISDNSVYDIYVPDEEIDPYSELI